MEVWDVRMDWEREPEKMRMVVRERVENLSGCEREKDEIGRGFYS